VDFFQYFTMERVLRVRHGGEGSPVVLLHGHPRTHTTWHRVAPVLAAGHHVVCPDLRGYGESTVPPTAPDHRQMSKREMAGDILRLMRALGHESFAVAGHDRGCYVAFRLALDSPEAVSRLVVMDGVPVVETLERADARFATAWWHWFFFGQTDKPAEDWISRDPDAWYRGDPTRMGGENHADWQRAIHRPETVHAMVEDYRAGLGLDREHDQADRRAGRTVRCPTLFAWSTLDDTEELYSDPLGIWAAWAPDVRGVRIESGHHMAEDAPEQLSRELLGFLAR
jgi:haloacetate dehalogenase